MKQIINGIRNALKKWREIGTWDVEIEEVFDTQNHLQNRNPWNTELHTNLGVKFSLWKSLTPKITSKIEIREIQKLTQIWVSNSPFVEIFDTQNRLQNRNPGNSETYANLGVKFSSNSRSRQILVSFRITLQGY